MKKPKFMDLVYACIALAFLVGAVQAHWGIVLSAAKMCAIALLFWSHQKENVNDYIFESRRATSTQ